MRFLIFHYTAVDDATSLKLLTGDNVSAHYLVSDQIDRRSGKPIVYRLVSENKRAWHAGLSNWNGRVNLNDSSVGIEIVNPGFTEDMLGQRRPGSLSSYSRQGPWLRWLKRLSSATTSRRITSLVTVISRRCENKTPENFFRGRCWPLGA